MKNKLKVHKNHLLLIGGIVWGIAGFNILKIGLTAYEGYFNWWRLLISLVVFAAFQFLIFNKMVRKHTKRILEYEEIRQYFIKFFDLKGFLIMAFMITLGVSLRLSGFVPDVYIAVFYSGLGSSLGVAGLLFVINYISTFRKTVADIDRDY